MPDSILVRKFKEDREVIATLPGKISFISYYRQYDCWFFSKSGESTIFMLDGYGEVSEWLMREELTDICGLCCGINAVFVLNKKCELYGFDIDTKDRYSVIGLRGIFDIQNKIRDGFAEGVNYLCYDKDRDSLYIPFPKRGDVCAVTGGSTISVEFGSKNKEFSIGTLATACGINNPICASASKKGEISIADQKAHVVWLFKTDSKKSSVHKLLGVYGSPNAEGSQDGELSKSSFSYPSYVFFIKNKLYVIDDSSKRIRALDLEQKSCETIYKTESEISCLTTDYNNNICWIENP